MIRTGAERREWMGMGVAGMTIFIVMKWIPHMSAFSTGKDSVCVAPIKCHLDPLVFSRHHPAAGIASAASEPIGPALSMENRPQARAQWFHGKADGTLADENGW